MKEKLILSILLMVTAAVHAAQGTHETKKPNVIFILTDDQGSGDLGITGHPYLRTPNIDRLAKEGTRFTQFYTNATVCAPSRVAFMTGQFPVQHNVHHIYMNHKFNVKRGIPDYLDRDAFTVGDLMKQAGYDTAHIGKWHLEGRDLKSPPSHYGFDEWLVTHDASASPSYIKRFNSTEHNVTMASHWIVDDVIEYLEKQKKSDKPFYLNLWTLVPHGLLNPSKEELAEYKNLNANSEDFKSWMKEYGEDAENFTEQMKVYCAAMTSTDKAIGRLLDYLDESGLSENTIVFYTSDNGPEDYKVGDATNAGVGSSGISRGRKRSMYEGGVNVPAIVRWPNKVKANHVSDAIWSGADWLPTLAKISGGKLPRTYKSDGEDVSDILFGKSKEHKKPLFWEWKYEVMGNKKYNPPQLAIRQGDWKFLCKPNGSAAELYNIKKDPAENNNLASKETSIANNMKTILLEWKKTIPTSAY
ncbi:sulfatase-like hydrolase/transferase [Lentisphaera profundi]|uniref:Sulfatase-like hydrolase/transferase n=1 Tax=Lentisphaera profundi TaxID=1658616 RepID=A0ABY7VU44_9BACT|nr:sulfatase-like hydrolase/transferase [Lentisphaera profundi]WDE97730.1 sulfatase-like hydrolase/transferase [Lentisphaera profundi]